MAPTQTFLEWLPPPHPPPHNVTFKSECSYTDTPLFAGTTLPLLVPAPVVSENYTKVIKILTENALFLTRSTRQLLRLFSVSLLPATSIEDTE